MLGMLVIIFSRDPITVDGFGSGKSQIMLVASLRIVSAARRKVV
jgi:hypothetical protein